MSSKRRSHCTHLDNKLRWTESATLFWHHSQQISFSINLVWKTTLIASFCLQLSLKSPQKKMKSLNFLKVWELCFRLRILSFNFNRSKSTFKTSNFPCFKTKWKKFPQLSAFNSQKALSTIKFCHQMTQDKHWWEKWKISSLN